MSLLDAETESSSDLIILSDSSSSLSDGSIKLSNPSIDVLMSLSDDSTRPSDDHGAAQGAIFVLGKPGGDASFPENMAALELNGLLGRGMRG